MSKSYGLILPGQKPKPVPGRSAPLGKPSIFGSDSDSDGSGPRLLKKQGVPLGPGASERRLAKKIQEKALAEDPTIFQYDEHYDEMESKREEEKKDKKTEVRKPKYIGRLLEYADKRKLENERRIERMVQKEREAEGEEFKDKETFVTSTYRKKLEELRKAEELEKREEYLESIGDVTKQKDLDGFYRHLYEQRLGGKEQVLDETPKYVPIRSQKSEDSISKKATQAKSRAYRKRCSSVEEEETTIDQTDEPERKKAHIQSNLDADSDFSIDSSDSEEEQKPSDKKKQTTSSKAPNEVVKLEPKDITSEAATQNPQKEENKLDSTMKLAQDLKTEVVEEKPIVKPKKDKTLVWKKRTVGEVFEAALQRYYERKAARQA